MATDPPRVRLEEQAALDELERLQRALEESRQRRRDASDAFDSFVRSFGSRSSDSRSTVPATRAPRSSGESIPPPMPPQLPRAPAALVSPPSAPWASTSRKSKTGPRLVAGAVVVLVAAGGFFAWRGRSPQSSETPAGPSEATAVGTSSPAAAPAPAPAPAPAAPIQAELTTARRVWVRVLVDGEKRLERELDANARIPLAAQKSIAVRVGDAGALRVVVNGKDVGPLGPDGQIATRTFTLPR